MDTIKFQELVLQQLQSLAVKIDSVDNRLEFVEKGQAGIETRLESFQKEVETRFESMDSRLESVEKGQSGIETRLESFQKEVETRFESMDSRLASVEKGQLRLESRMESEVIDKIKALFDDREVRNDRLERIESKLDVVASDTGYLMTRVTRLEALAK
ncbi:MAG: hypothetical protein VR68_12125 [Peptococcaceae bacterium BRH_c4a]|nr:MAG: hypothetical protein VR68_12125 [Peptococcaceae bacterium BRH_c4a]